MAVNNINNPISPGGPVKRDQDASSIRSARTGRPHEAEEIPKQTPEIGRTEQAAEDTFQISQEHGLVEELTKTVENMEEAPREDVVARISERVRNGDFNTNEFMERLALKLINTES